jgi:3-oxoacyl-[acyl-carrier protein] reductase
MDLQIKDRIFLVTAASRGLGYSVAEALTREGAEVIICGRHESTLKQAMKSLGNSTQYIVADVANHSDVKAMVDEIAASHDRLDGLFVNAGGPPPGEFSDLTDEDWQHAFNLNLMSAVWLTRDALPLLKKSDAPTILYSTSISVKEPIKNLLLSNAIRPAVIGMMRTIADELGPEGIRVNAVCPGYIYTRRVEELMAASKTPDSDPTAATNARIPLRRMGRPTEFGNVCTFLMSPLASYIHGALLLIDGGLYRGMM